MTFAEDKTYKYIRDNHSKFCCVDVLEILPYLSCLTASDQDRLRASYRQLGNQDTLWELFNKLQRRLGWVEVFIRALRICELPGLAEQVTQVYQSYLPPVGLFICGYYCALSNKKWLWWGQRWLWQGSVGDDSCEEEALGQRRRVSTNSLAGISLRSLDPLLSPANPATVSGPSAFAPGPSIPDSGFQERPSYSKPVQDTQPSESPVEDLEQPPQANFRAVPRMSGGSLIPSPNLQVLSPQPSREHHEQEPELGGTYTANVDSIPIATYGPVSPTVSFQPLPRIARRTNLLPGVTVSPPSADTSLSSSSTGSAFAQGAGDQVKATICLNTQPTNSVTPSSAPPIRFIPVNTMSSKLPISTKSTAAMSFTMLTDKVPSKLPSNSANAATMPSKVPASVAKAPANIVPPERNRKQAKETLDTPATIGSTGGNLTRPDSTSRSLHSGSEMSKPGVLVSQEGNEPFSTLSVDLAISPSSSLSSEPNHGPEENEYSSFRIQAGEGPSADLLGSPGPLDTQQAQEEEEPCSVSSATWFGATSILLAAFLAVMLYRSRRLAQ